MTVQKCCLTLGWDTIGWDNISQDVQSLGIDLSPVGELSVWIQHLDLIIFLVPRWDMHFKKKHANNVLFNVTETLWRRGKRCALRCDVIVTDVNEQKGASGSLYMYQTATRGTRQARAVPDRKSRNPSSGGIFLSQVREY